MDWTYLDAHWLSEVAKKACLRAARKSKSKYTNDALVAIIFSVSTLEAYLSEVIDSAKAFSTMHPRIKFLGELFGCLDEKQISLKDKYNLVRLILCEKAFDTGGPPFQDFSLLVNIRNALIHLKPDKTSSTETRKTNIIKELRQKKIIPEEENPFLKSTGKRASWVMYLLNPSVAKWSCNAANLMMQGLWEEVTEEKIKAFSRQVARPRRIAITKYKKKKKKS